MIMHNTAKLHSPPKYVKINTVVVDPNCYEIIYKEITRAKIMRMPNKLVKFNI